MVNLLIDISVFVGIGLIIFALLKYRKIKKPSASEKKEITLEALSTLWNKHQTVKLSIEELVAIWRDKAIIDAGKAKQITYNNPEIQEFYLNHINSNIVFSGNAGDVIRNILTLLDKEGDCPSVVNTKGEIEASLEKNSYDLLAQVSLTKHSINVAEEMLKMFKNKIVMYPKIIIGALGHDLGKLPSYRKKLYSIGDHPLISVTILEGINGYKELPYRAEISKAIMEHHRNPKGMFAETMKIADQNSRRAELSLQVKKEGQKENPSELDQEITQSNQSNFSFANHITKINEGSIFAEQPENESKKDDAKPTEIHIAWLNADEIITELKPHINKLIGNRWRAFSMNNGYAYFQVSVIEEIIGKLGRKHNDSNIALMNADKRLRRDIIFSVISFLRREKQAIADGLIKNDFIGGHFKVKKTNGVEYDAYYVPFNLEVFGETVSYFENAKFGVLKDIESVNIKDASS